MRNKFYNKKNLHYKKKKIMKLIIEIKKKKQREKKKEMYVYVYVCVIVANHVF